MMKRTIACCLALCYASPTHPNAPKIVLSNQLLKVADQAGLFNKAIVDILKVRQKIKEFVSGKLFWKGAQCSLTIVDAQHNPTAAKLRIIMKRPETLFGATFIVISPNHPDIASYETTGTRAAIQELIATTNKQAMLSRYEHPNNIGIATGLFALNPITQEPMPIFVADYILEAYDARITHAHVAVPAHDQKDFNFAHAHNLPVKLVINSPELGKASSPQYHKTTHQLIAAYPGEYNDCLIVNSKFLDGAIHEAYDKALEYLQKNAGAEEYKKPYVYQLGNKQYSLQELSLIEMTLQKEHKELSAAQKEMMAIIMIQAQADFLTIVEQFLVNAREAKELMIEIIDESCALRGSNDAYLLKWAHLNTTESEKTIFKRDINNFTGLCKFSAELVDFLGDFASSLPNALETIKNLKHT